MRQSHYGAPAKNVCRLVYYEHHTDMIVRANSRRSSAQREKRACGSKWSPQASQAAAEEMFPHTPRKTRVRVKSKRQRQ